jgi:hypothetical protein
MAGALVLCAAGVPGTAQQPAGCEPDGRVAFICGMVSPEDLVAVPKSDWVVVSGWTGGAVHLVNTRDHGTVQVYPAAKPLERHDKSLYGACPGPLDPAEKEKFSAHGLAARAGSGSVHTIYLVHHGFRESIEVFEIDTAPKVPTFTWVGCVVAPASVGLNSVSPLPGDGFVATNPNRKGEAAVAQARQAGANTGEVWEWNPKDGWRIVPGSESQGPNGIEASADGRVLYINLWPARQVMRLSRGETPVRKEVVSVNFQPDNIRWQPDGTLFAAGHGGPSMQRVIECFKQVCPDTSSNVARIDPKTMAVEHLITYPANPKFSNSTAALEVGKEVWIGTISGDRVARHPLP